uniref:Uncharacterized protein n=1 Tax=Polytomella parva TaxID=51329 RepID=A0A7S0VAE7_9CHLO|mmetsp:Transcript_28986/g.53267  ORF Transcript_28986/g.53267 Transcript_28986/m.53267 type:complete len:799 (+) Transcript_28986:120-2516(+)|eukprot:CAMPEP_0175072146 /NCGR_PEP_ID=MMETSP0052_2-20121109/19715_1 /TAXON_ID=51329 ORGANISM="Polytomella parva, Strain SAG 63-3" /NCGR_SAMPLE_ID=MMETSP0052_2 /ASSEMBLY_ACC=CAM_ASM_000194 /LENGTH=798 /DNA_ID=CAMNT_0016339553 /DNA_START=129 /DNA_END=2525 /DNA_ORIENTATION=-
MSIPLSANNGAIIIVPSASSYELPNKKKSHVSKKKLSDDLSLYDPKNFMVKGGGRSYEHKVLQMNKAIMQDLRKANEVLAEELLRTKQDAFGENDRLRTELALTQQHLSIEQQRVSEMTEAMESVSKARKLQDRKHLLQLRELGKRYKEEQSQRNTISADISVVKQARDTFKEQVESLQEERAQLLDMISQQRSACGKLEATVAADTAVVAELRTRVLTLDAKLEAETSQNQKMFSQNKSLEIEVQVLTERSNTLQTTNLDLESRIRAAETKIRQSEEETSIAVSTAAREREIQEDLNRRLSTLQNTLSDMQSSAAVATAVAASDKSDRERLFVELQLLKKENEELKVGQMRLKEEANTLSSANAALQEKLQAHEKFEAKNVVSEVVPEQVSLQQQIDRERSLLQREFNLREELLKRELESKEEKVAEVTKRLKEKTDAMGETVEQLAVFKAKLETAQAVAQDHEARGLKIQKLESDLAEKESHLQQAQQQQAAQLELWRSEATEVAQAAAKWKQRATGLESQLEARDHHLEAARQELDALRVRLTNSESDRLKAQQTAAALDSRLVLLEQEAAAFKVQLADALAANQRVARNVEAAEHEIESKDALLEKLNKRLADEQNKTSHLRVDLARISSQHVKELENKSSTIAELSTQLHENQQAKQAALNTVQSLTTQLAAYRVQLTSGTSNPTSKFKSISSASSDHFDNFTNDSSNEEVKDGKRNKLSNDALKRSYGKKSVEDTNYVSRNVDKSKSTPTSDHLTAKFRQSLYIDSDDEEGMGDVLAAVRLQSRLNALLERN